MSIFAVGEAGCKWHFAGVPENTNDVGPNEPMKENFKKTPYASLVREAIQNSLDVRKNPDEPVTVSFAIKSSQIQNLTELLKIEDNINACLEFYSENDTAPSIYKPMLDYIAKVKNEKRMYYIQVSDSNTIGMNYITDRSNKSYTNTPFYSFVRSAGVSSKKGPGAGGSYGYGKAAYFFISAIRTLIVSTRTDDNKYFFEGVASLCTHRVGGEKRAAIGYYDSTDGEPMSDKKTIPSRFARKIDDNTEKPSGTDINIMGIDFREKETKETIYKEMIEAVLRNFFMAIYRRDLVVVVGEKTITAENIKGIMGKYFPEEHDDKQKGSYFNPRPFLNTVALCGQDDKHQLFTRDLNAEAELKALNSDINDWGTFELYLWKRKKAISKIIKMRAPLMTVSIRSAQSGEGYYGVFICPDGYANEMLRSMENPAHNVWSSSQIDKSDDSVKRNIARKLEDVMNRFIDESIRKFFNLDDIQCARINGIDQYLYIPTELDNDNDDDEDAQSSVVGQPTGRLEDNGTSLTTDGGDVSVNGPTGPNSVNGTVVIKRHDTEKPDKGGKDRSGRGNKKIKHPNPDGDAPGNSPDTPTTHADDGKKGTYLSQLSVRYRAFSLKQDGKLVHRIIIHSDTIAPKAQIDLVVGGEDSDSKIGLVDASDGKIDGNSIKDVSLAIGSNTFTVQFADNLKHAIKLKAYEIK